MSDRISGQREHNGEIVASRVARGIITIEQTQRLSDVLGDSGRFAGVARPALLPGL